MGFDQSIFALVNNLAGKSQLLDFWGIFFAEYSGYLLVALAIFLLFGFESRKERFHYFSIFVLAAILSRGLITEVIRFFYYRPRPFSVLDIVPLIEQVEKGAFPSGHASFYFALAGVIFLINRRLSWYVFAVVFVMGLARVFVGIHWPTDILGGLIVGILSVFIVNLLLGPYKPVLAGQSGKRELS